MDEAAMHMTTIADMVIAVEDTRRVFFDFEFMILGGPFYITLFLLGFYEGKNSLQRHRSNAPMIHASFKLIFLNNF